MTSRANRNERKDEKPKDAQPTVQKARKGIGRSAAAIDDIDAMVEPKKKNPKPY